MPDDLNDYYNSIKIHTDSNGIQVVGMADNAICDLDELSVSNIKYLDKWMEKCRDIHSYELSDLSHDKAWKFAGRYNGKTRARGFGARCPVGEGRLEIQGRTHGKPKRIIIIGVDRDNFPAIHSNSGRYSKCIVS